MRDLLSPVKATAHGRPRSSVQVTDAEFTQQWMAERNHARDLIVRECRDDPVGDKPAGQGYGERAAEMAVADARHLELAARARLPERFSREQRRDRAQRLDRGRNISGSHRVEPSASGGGYRDQPKRHEMGQVGRGRRPGDACRGREVRRGVGLAVHQPQQHGGPGRLADGPCHRGQVVVRGVHTLMLGH